MWKISAIAAALTAVYMATAAAADQPLYGASFETISNLVHDAAGAEGAAGAVLILGAGEAVFYVETAGAAGVETLLVLPSHADLVETTLLLALADRGLLDLDRPVGHYLPKADPKPALTARDLVAVRAGAAPVRAQAAAQLLIHTAEAAAAQPWARLVDREIGGPAGFRHTNYPVAPVGVAAFSGAAANGILHTTARDYARLLSLYVNGGMVEGEEVLTPEAADMGLNRAFLNQAQCRDPRADGGCGGLEALAPGLYAFIDRDSGLYGVLAAPGTQNELAMEGRLIRDMAAALSAPTVSRPGSGITAATAAQP